MGFGGGLGLGGGRFACRRFAAAARRRLARRHRRDGTAGFDRRVVVSVASRRLVAALDCVEDLVPDTARISTRRPPFRPGLTLRLTARLNAETET